MKTIIILSIAVLLISSCNKKPKDDIVYKSLNKEFVVIRDLAVLKQSNDEISKRIDSIISGLINEELISSGMKTFDLNFDRIADISFEIIDLNKYNFNLLPDSLDSLAIRAIPINIEILDNSTYGYADALNINGEISEDMKWRNNICVLGTFMNAGNFQGKGEKYLGFRFVNNGNYKYGWIKLYCSQHNDTLKIIDYAYNNTIGKEILAGQKD